MDVYHESQVHQIYGRTISHIVLATVAMVARLGARKVSVANLWWDDLTIVLALIFLAIQVLYFSSAVAIKTSLILLYHRIFGVIRRFRWALAAALTIVVLYFIVCLIVAVLECHPVAFYWDKSIRGGTCINQNQFYRWNGVSNLLIDFMV
ncbi:MAG: hypothetical protein Q9173_003048 [Seirophora scorigena]